MLRLPSFKRFSHRASFSPKRYAKKQEVHADAVVKKPKIINKKRLRTWVFIIALIGIIIGIYIAVDTVFRVHKIEVLNAASRPLGIEMLQGDNMFTLSESDTEKEIERNNPLISKTTVAKVFPDTVRISVEYTQPIAYLQIANGYLLLDESAKILGKTREKDNQYPYITYYQKFQYNSFTTGDKIDYKDILMSLHFLRKTLDLGVKISSIDINGLDMIALNADDRRILFTTGKEEDLQIYQLETILQNFKIENKDFTSLDLRFDKPVVVFK